MNVTFEIKQIRINGAPYSILLQANDKEHNALIALANVLLLSPSLANFAYNLINFVRNKRVVSLNELVETLANIGIQNPSGVNTNINQLLQILPQLQNWLTVNPEFNGSFEDSSEISVFRLYNVGIVHGWMIDGESDPIAYDHVSKYSYREAQRVLVQSYDLKRENQPLNNEAQAIIEDSNYLKSFLARSASQFTEYGLKHLKEILVEKSFAVLYRNDHFFTLYKNNGELYTLVSDFEHKGNNELVWKSLKSINGSQDTYQTGSFIPITVDANAQTITTNNNLGNQISNPFSDDNNQADSNAYGRKTSNLADNVNTSQQLEDDEELARMLQEDEDRAAADRLQGIALLQANKEEKKNKKHKRSSFFAGSHSDKTDKSKKDKKKKSCIVM